jgi:membrane-bound serine protease (ClpP class)
MISTITFLFVLGVVMILLEIFLPGGILGIMGGLAMVAGCVLAFREYGPGGGLVAVAAAVAMVALGLVLEFVYLPRTKFGQRMFLKSAVTGTTSKAVDLKTIEGRECESVTVLAPTGVVLLDGEKHEAFCRDGYTPSGTRLIVRGSDNFRLIVSKS